MQRRPSGGGFASQNTQIAVDAKRGKQTINCPRDAWDNLLLRAALVDLVSAQ